VHVAAAALARARCHAVSSLFKVGTFSSHLRDSVPLLDDADVGEGLAC
jgi:hypothetical protein